MQLYPGAASDIPITFYSFSVSRMLPSSAFQAGAKTSRHLHPQFYPAYRVKSDWASQPLIKECMLPAHTYPRAGETDFRSRAKTCTKSATNSTSTTLSTARWSKKPASPGPTDCGT